MARPIDEGIVSQILRHIGVPFPGKGESWETRYELPKEMKGVEGVYLEGGCFPWAVWTERQGWIKPFAAYK